MFQPCGYVFQQELVLDGEAVEEDIVDGEGAEHPVLGGVVAECLWVGYIVLVLVVAFDADAEHVVDGLTDAVEGGAGEGDGRHLGHWRAKVGRCVRNRSFRHVV